MNSFKNKRNYTGETNHDGERGNAREDLDWLLVHSVYRLRVRGGKYLPETGPALLVCNHQSLADALVVSAACRRPIRFLMYYTIFNIPVLNFIFRSMKAIRYIAGELGAGLYGANPE